MKEMKRRLITGALIAFTILLILIIGGIVIFGHIQMENEGDAFIDRMLNEAPPFMRRSGLPIFGYQPKMRNAPAGYYDLLIDDAGQITRQDAIGIFDQDSADVSSMVQTILQNGTERGKLGSYKYGVGATDESMRIILLDQSIQLHAMTSILRGAVMVGLICLILMFLILQPIARYIARLDMAAQERERQFITNASHELKTPVAVIQSNIEALEMMQGENKWSRNVHHQVIRLNHMIAQLLMMERIDEHRTRQKPQSVELACIIHQVSAEMHELMEQRQLNTAINCEGSLKIRGYEEALTQLLWILLDNASKYASEGSTVLLNASMAKKDAVLICENRVAALPDCPPEQLFERFHRGGIIRQPGDLGCGIGLSAAMGIVAMHRGDIGASYPDTHTFRITVKLPV